jgi:SPP1 gp7 family putative phage head morphogenesis protein
MPTADLGYAIGLKPEQAMEYFQAKNFTLSFNWREVEAEAHACSFTVAGILKMDVLETIHQSLADALATGQSQASWEKTITPVLEKKGWMGNGLKADEDGVLEGKQLLPYRLDTIYRTNMQSAYAAGHYQQQRANVSFRPYWEYVAVMDNRTRPTHAALNGQTFRWDDPFWDACYPPNGFNCRCRVRTRSEGDMKDHPSGVLSSEGRMTVVNQPWRDGTTRPVLAYDDPKSGQRFVPDAGFGHNAGRSYLSSLGQRLLEKATVATPQLAAMAMQETLENPALRQSIGADITALQSRIAQYPAFASDRRYAGGLSPSLLNKLPALGVTPVSATVAVTGDVIAQTHAVPPDWSVLPDLLYQPDAVLWDGVEKLLHYVIAGDTAAYTASVGIVDGQPLVATYGALDAQQRSALTALPVLSGAW